LVEEVVKDVLPLELSIYLHAQIQVVDFYEKLNFIKEGDLFEEAGIKHYLMRLKP
jgi:predicted GNAT family N-acyltransferase